MARGLLILICITAPILTGCRGKPAPETLPVAPQETPELSCDEEVFVYADQLNVLELCTMLHDEHGMSCLHDEEIESTLEGLRVSLMIPRNVSFTQIATLLTQVLRPYALSFECQADGLHVRRHVEPDTHDEARPQKADEPPTIETSKFKFKLDLEDFSLNELLKHLVKVTGLTVGVDPSAVEHLDSTKLSISTPEPVSNNEILVIVDKELKKAHFDTEYYENTLVVRKRPAQVSPDVQKIIDEALE